MKHRIRIASLALSIVVLNAADRVGPASAYPPKDIIGATSSAVTESTSKETVCVADYTAGVRDVTEADKRFVLKRDRQTKKGCCEVDHLISLELGGSNDRDHNLWAQPYSGKYGARVKDVVETALHRLVCGGHMTLHEAQSCIVTDWIACGRKIGAIK